MNDCHLLPRAVSHEGEGNQRKGENGVKTAWIFSLFCLLGEMASKLYGVLYGCTIRLVFVLLFSPLRVQSLRSFNIHED